MKPILLLIIILVQPINLFAQPFTDNTRKMTSAAYPFEVTERDGQFIILAQIESEELFTKYNPLFERNGYSGNGYSWEGHITQILEKIDKELLDHIEFDPEAGAFYAYANSKSSQQRFIEALSPIFTDLTRLEEYVISAERDRIDD